ncbi:MAG: fused MFS/spermidine synthase [Candidatus Obscuribacterales bacterium]|nr:fused MFS/spermidine synthase [Candidatus Obscuribacterales bacterium]
MENQDGIKKQEISKEKKEQDSDISKHKNLAVIASILFFLSGLSSLIYQVIWTRQLVFVFGSSTFASSTVLSTFMGGLALGSIFAGRRADRIKDSLLAYGMLEGIIGIWAIATPYMLETAVPLYKALWQQFHLSVMPFSLLRFLVVAIILIPPTACMGATLPFLSRAVTRNINLVGSSVGNLYSINTLGAVLGALAAGFYLIPQFGLFNTNISAACINIALALLVLFISKKFLPEIREAAKPVLYEGSETGLSLNVKACLLAFAISGAIAMIYEVAWTRALLMIIGSTTYAFSIMLTTFLAGIFLGSAATARFCDKLKDPFFCFAILQLLLCASTILSIELFNHLPYWNLIANRHNLNNPNLSMYTRFLLAASILTPVAICLGASFPLAVKICSKSLEQIGRSVGTLYSVNTLGAIIGAFTAGFIIIPLLGAEKTLLLSAITNFALGTVLLTLCPQKRLIKAAAISLLAVLSLWSALKQESWDQKIIACSQKLRRHLAKTGTDIPEFSKWKKQIDDSADILFWKNGLCANVAVFRFDDNVTSLLTNGHIDASTNSTDVAAQGLLPTVPLLLKPDAVDVCNIGWGSGMTMGYAFLFPIKRLVCAEIEKEVISTSEFFHQINLAPEKDPRLEIEINDGRNFLLSTNEKFDVLISEPSNPWQAGVCNLYTTEYFDTCKARLKPEGIFTLWWQYNEVSSTNVARVLSALKTVFKHVLVFGSSTTGDICAIASADPIKLDLNKLKRGFSQEKRKALLSKTLGLSGPEDLASIIALSEESVNRIASQAASNTDDRNYIEFDVARTYEHQNFKRSNSEWLLSNAGPLWDSIDWTAYTPQEQAEEMGQIALHALTRNSPTAKLWAEESLKIAQNPTAYGALSQLAAQQEGNLESALSFANKAVALSETRKFKLADFYKVRAMVELLGGACLAARRDFEKSLQSRPDDIDAQIRLAQTYLPDYRGWYQTAIMPLQDIGVADTNPREVIRLLVPQMNKITDPKAHAVASALLGTAYFKTGETDKSIRPLEEFCSKNADREAFGILAAAYKKKGIFSKSEYYAQQAEQMANRECLFYLETAKQLISRKQEEKAVEFLRKALIVLPSAEEIRPILWKLAEHNEEAEKLMSSIKISDADIEAYKSLLKRKQQKRK